MTVGAGHHKFVSLSNSAKFTVILPSAVVEVKVISSLAGAIGEGGQNNGLVKVMIGEINIQVPYDIVCEGPIHDLIRVRVFCLLFLVIFGYLAIDVQDAHIHWFC